MSLLEKVEKDIKNAMLAREKDKLEALRAVKTALTVLKTQENATEITEDVEIKLLQKLVKQRRDAAFIYHEQGRGELEFVEVQQAMFIEKYLPEQMSVEELKTILTGIVKEVGATSMRDMGKVMGMANQKIGGKADGKVVAQLVKEIMGNL